jgi:site-specific DNA-methyltransferase (adenine-specific)
MTVFLNHRTLEQPEFKLSSGLSLNKQQTMNGLDLLSRIDNESVPLVFFDPQYRSILDKQKYGNEGERQKNRSKLIQMDNSCIVDFINQIERILMPSGHVMIWMDKFLVCNGYSNMFPIIKNYKTAICIVDMVTWDKQRIGMGYRTRRCSEHLMIFQKPPIRAKGIWKLHNIPDIWIEKPDKSHPHAKPLGLLKAMINATTNEGDVVVDPAAGGYNVLKATKETNRNFLGCDLT